MYELKKIGKVLASKSVGTGPSSYEKRIYRAAVSQRLRNTGIDCTGHGTVCTCDQIRPVCYFNGGKASKLTRGEELLSHL